VAGRQLPPPLLLHHQQGQKRKSPLRTGPRMGWLACGAARRARQPAPGHPITCARVGQSGVAGCRGGKGEEEESHAADQWGPSVKEREERRRGGASWATQLSGPTGLLGWPGSGLAGSAGWFPRFEPTTRVSD
jgi:hypothetical protein